MTILIILDLIAGSVIASGPSWICAFPASRTAPPQRPGLTLLGTVALPALVIMSLFGMNIEYPSWTKSLNLGDTGRGPRGTLGFLLFSPRTHSATQLYPPIFDFDRDPSGVHWGAASERVLNLPYDLLGWRMGLNRDLVGDVSDTSSFRTAILRPSAGIAS